MAEKKKTILVTGGAGLIGSNLIELALKKYRVVSLDNYFIGSKDNHIEGAEYIEGHTKNIEKLVGNESPEIIFHLGEYSRVEQSFKDIKLVWESNVAGTFQVFEYWRKRGCRLVYAGSSTKFADGGLGRDQSPYAWMKASNTELVRNYGNWFDLPYAITYFYNAYGPRELADRSVCVRLRQIQDVVSAAEAYYGSRAGDTETQLHPRQGSRARTSRGGGEGEGRRVRPWEPRIILGPRYCADVRGEIQMLPERQGNRMESIVDTSRAEKEFGWKPQHTVREYIKSLKAQKGVVT